MVIGTLFTFVGTHDPEWRDGNDEAAKVGPIITAVANHPFRYIHLFATPPMRDRAKATVERINRIRPGTRVMLHALAIEDPTSYHSILGALVPLVKSIVRRSSANIMVSVASGTPQMHACWVILLATGVIKGSLLRLTAPKYLQEGRSPVEQITVATRYPYFQTA